MFAKLLEDPSLSSSQQKQILKAIIQTNLKKNLPQVRLQLTHNYTALKPILLSQWKYALRIALSLINWQTAKQIIEGKRQCIPFDLLVSIANSESDVVAKSKHILTQLPKTYPQPWKGIIILIITSEILINRVQYSQYDWLLPSFVRLSATIIQTYLTTKHQPTKSTDDRIESDMFLVQNCQTWVEKTYSLLFGSMKAPQGQEMRKIMLIALSQIVAALCQSDRQGNLDHQRLMRLLNQVKTYIFGSYRVDQVQSYLVTRLKQLNYNNPIKKLQIPEVYTQKSDLSSQGIAWIINQFVKQSTNIISKPRQLSLLLLAYAQVLSSALKLRQQLGQSVKKLIGQTSTTPNFQTNYPIALLLFKLHTYSPQSQSIFSALSSQWTKTKVNRLRRLQSLNLGSLNVDKTKYVFGQLGEEEIALKEAVLLAKVVEFDFMDEGVGKLIIGVFGRLAKEHGEAAKKILREVVNREKLAKRNVELCDRISLDL